MNTRKQCPLDTVEQLHAWTHGSYDSRHEPCASASQGEHSMESRDGHEWSPALSQGTAGNCCLMGEWQQETVFLKNIVTNRQEYLMLTLKMCLVLKKRNYNKGGVKTCLPRLLDFSPYPQFLPHHHIPPQNLIPETPWSRGKRGSIAEKLNPQSMVFTWLLSTLTQSIYPLEKG